MQWFPFSVDLSVEEELSDVRLTYDVLTGKSTLQDLEVRRYDLHYPSEMERVTQEMKHSISENQAQCFGDHASHLHLRTYTHLFVCFQHGHDDSPVASLVIKGNMIWNFCVQKAFRKQGVGGLMLRTVIDFFQQNKNTMKPCQLFVRQDNVHAQKFYLKHGFLFVQKSENGYGPVHLVGDTSEKHLLIQNTASSYVEFLMQYQHQEHPPE